jgi:N-acetylglutamate synthase-like GNAT family acetyltransferase
MQLQVRIATQQDVAEISRLCTQLGYPSSQEVMGERLAQLLCSPNHAVRVACEGHALAGWASGEVRVTLESGTRAEITGLIVDATVRRSGVGRLLVAEIEAWARGIGCGEVVVRSNVSRLESHPFYENLGYGRAKTQHAYKKVLGDF